MKDDYKSQAKAIARRLTVVRTLVAGDNMAEFARILDIKPSRWRNLERGYPLTMQMAFRLVKNVDGLSTGYLVQGLYGAVDRKLAKKLRLKEKELARFDQE